MPYGNSYGPDECARPCVCPSDMDILCSSTYTTIFILLADNVDQDQPVRMRRLIMAFAARKLHKGPFLELHINYVNTSCQQTILFLSDSF